MSILTASIANKSNLKMNILIADESLQGFTEITELFQSVGAKAAIASNSANLLHLLESDSFDLALVSIPLVNADHWKLLGKIKENISLIIGLTDNASSVLMQEGILHGIDSYMTKPIDSLSLQIYLPTILSQSGAGKQPADIENDKDRRKKFDRRLNPANRRWYDRLKQMPYLNLSNRVAKTGTLEINDLQKTISLNGKKVECSPKEYKLLQFFMLNDGRVVTTEEILAHIWPDNRRACEDDVKQYVHLLRKKIEQDSSNPKYIQTVKGFGYIANFTE